MTDAQDPHFSKGQQCRYFLISDVDTNQIDGVYTTNRITQTKT
jgi:hypothetical protein